MFPHTWNCVCHPRYIGRLSMLPATCSLLWKKILIPFLSFFRGRWSTTRATTGFQKPQKALAYSNPCNCRNVSCATEASWKYPLNSTDAENFTKILDIPTTYTPLYLWKESLGVEILCPTEVHEPQQQLKQKHWAKILERKSMQGWLK